MSHWGSSHFKHFHLQRCSNYEYHSRAHFIPHTVIVFSQKSSVVKFLVWEWCHCHSFQSNPAFILIVVILSIHHWKLTPLACRIQLSLFPTFFFPFTTSLRYTRLLPTFISRHRASLFLFQILVLMAFVVSLNLANWFYIYIRTSTSS